MLLPGSYIQVLGGLLMKRAGWRKSTWLRLEANRMLELHLLSPVSAAATVVAIGLERQGSNFANCFLLCIILYLILNLIAILCSIDGNRQAWLDVELTANWFVCRLHVPLISAGLSADGHPLFAATSESLLTIVRSLCGASWWLHQFRLEFSLSFFHCYFAPTSNYRSRRDSDAIIIDQEPRKPRDRFGRNFVYIFRWITHVIEGKEIATGDGTSRVEPGVGSLVELLYYLDVTLLGIQNQWELAWLILELNRLFRHIFFSILRFVKLLVNSCHLVGDRESWLVAGELFLYVGRFKVMFEVRVSGFIGQVRLVVFGATVLVGLNDWNAILYYFQRVESPVLLLVRTHDLVTSYIDVSRLVCLCHGNRTVQFDRELQRKILLHLLLVT